MNAVVPMSPTDDAELLATWRAATREVAWPRFSALLQLGVPAGVTVWGGEFMVGFDSVAIRHCLWVRRFNCDPAIILPVFDPAGDMVDLVAFRPDTPRSFWLHTGAGVMLGTENLEDAAHDRAAVFIHETPLDWLRSGCDGIVILDWRHYWPLYFADIPAVQVADIQFGRRVAAAFERPLSGPEIMVAA